MRSLIRRKNTPTTPKADPAPSRWAWRMQRLMLTPGFRLMLRAGVPFCLTLLAGTIYLADDTRRARIVDGVAEARRAIEERPEFMVKLMAIDGAEDKLAADIRAAVPIEFPLSSFDLDLEQVRETIKSLNSVKNASVRIKPGGVLQVIVMPRVPVAIWRTAEGLTLVDEGGAPVGPIASRTERPDLPLIAGEGAARHVPEALILIQATAPIADRVRGLVRMGARRWDVVLDRGQRILLPETDALRALERVIALEGAQEMLTRDVSHVDMRLAQRPTVRMTQEATEAWWNIIQSSGH
ncbi:cell division protein FtsQ [Sulfitobacter sp. THAF37]|uniref:cell division protein FtsQ/DivIB n=1 Tax=Sulfitobacter sp. THAF37 TaxID=2587855 RepID=UPI001267A610|nr:cell division protein FtsQ/DivIB [Sulfitobacter sp. THAF37]QFT60356.1 cell division protein FtsQ [Sulfitobacter sp. THAF37]